VARTLKLEEKSANSTGSVNLRLTERRLPRVQTVVGGERFSNVTTKFIDAGDCEYDRHNPFSRGLLRPAIPLAGSEHAILYRQKPPRAEEVDGIAKDGNWGGV
jgi:hypothetical protein